MNIQELSNRTHINKETIRSYRLKGLLRPIQADNGYYEYSEEDVYILLYIRQLRDYGMPLEHIRHAFDTLESDYQVALYDQQIAETEAEIERLKKRVDSLKKTKQHQELSKANLNRVEIEYYEETKYDIYPSDGPDSEILTKWLQNINMCTITLNIDKNELAMTTHGKIPIKAGIGTFQWFVKRAELPLTPKIVQFPSGYYCSAIIEVDNIHALDASCLIPIRNYINEHHYTLGSDVTGFLVRVDYSKVRPRFYFRIRVLIKNKD